MPAPKKWSFFTALCLLFSFHAVGAEQISFSTWNLEWLSSSPSSKFEQSQRSTSDYQALNRHFNNIKSDVVAFQEVNDADALVKVIGNDYQLFFSQRSESDNRRHQFDDINQYTGFAVRNGIAVSNQRDLRLDNSSNSKMRFASYIIIRPNGKQPVHALSVHLKARCSGRFNSSRDCKILKHQGRALNGWIKQREAAKDAYIILGDFNHNMGYQRDWLWDEIAQDTQATLVSQSTKAECKVRSRNNPRKTHQFRSLIDHIIVSESLTASKAKQDVYPVEDVLNHQLSDHCPLSSDIR